MVTRKPEKGDHSSADLEEHDEMEESSDEDELMKDDVEDAERLNFDFEAYPLCDGDKESLVNLLTQIFLRADVDVAQMADILIKQSPFGCVFRPAEEFMDEDNEDVAYGVLSILELGTDQKFHTDIWTLLKTRARKYALDKKITSKLDSLSAAESGSRVGLLINERLLHFPAAIAVPAFKSLKDDLKNSGSQYRFSHVILILKIRIADSSSSSNQETSGTSTGNAPKKGKKLSKAQKRRMAANAVADADVIYDNPEEELLFQGTVDCEYFQYPVQSEVEKDSKFSSVTLKGITYRPYRRICILDNAAFQQYIDVVSTAEGL